MFPLSDSIKARSFPIVNIAIILVTVYVFFLQITAPDFEAFIYEYALVPSLIDFVNYQTLLPFITAMFLHGGWLHIISNLWFLWVFGDNVEGHLGFLFFPVLYFAAGIIGNAAQYLLMSTSQIPMLGASGAVAGILGAYYVLFPQSKIKTLFPVFGFVSIVEIAAPFMLGYWFILQLISGAVSLPFAGEAGGIAFFAHAGGFITGVVFANIIKRDEKSQPNGVLARYINPPTMILGSIIVGMSILISNYFISNLTLSDSLHFFILRA